MYHHISFFVFFFFNDTATTEIYTLSLHDALPISHSRLGAVGNPQFGQDVLHMDFDRAHTHRQVAGNLPVGLSLGEQLQHFALADRKSTRLNSSHGYISYAVFCLKKKKNYTRHYRS